MPDAVGPVGLADSRTATLRSVSRGVAAVTLIGAVIAAAWALDVPVLRDVLPDSMSGHVRIGLPLVVLLVLLLLAAGALFMWWNTRSLLRAEARIIHRDRLYAMLSHCNQAIVHSPDAATLLPRVCQIACDEGGFRGASIAWTDLAGAIEVRACHGTGDVPNDLVTRAITTNAHSFVNEVGAFPIRFQGKPRGALVVSSERADEFAQDELRLLDEVAGDVSFALETFDREERRRAAEESLRETTHMLQTLVDASPLAIVVVDENRNTLLWSPAAERLFGWTAEEVIGRPLPYVPVADIPSIRPVRPDRQFAVERRRVRKDGTLIDVSLWSSPLQDAGGRIIGTLGILADMTERRQFERQIRQSQKLDALGTIAGGIAHDFNNILTVLRGNLSLAQMTLPADHTMRTSLTEMNKACDRAADLVRQILTFGRQQEQSRQIIMLQPAVKEALQLLRATIPTGIEIETHLPESLPTAMADGTQILQIVLNLGINAAQAMEPPRGRITLSLEAVDVDEALAGTCPELHQGRYVRLSVVDTGAGMDRATLERAFEPFFTTKSAGRGTGLGLAVVRGIVRNHDGAITVVSEPGKGSRFDVYFPVVDGEVTGKHRHVVEALHGNGERVLFLDDEEPLVRLASRMLDRLGYRVEAYTRASEALDAFRGEPQRFDLVLTDLSMPGASGMDFAKSVLDIRPDVPVILTTGYIDPDDMDLVRRIGIREVILKPTTIEEMGRSFRRLLAGRVQ